MAESPDHAAVWFVSDVHLTPSRPERTARFLRFLEDRVAPAGTDLVIAGDLFDWWFGAWPPPPDVAQVIAALEALPGAVLWMEGNHDLFVGRGLRASSPIATSAEPVAMSRFDMTLHVAHGDMVDPAERGYRLFRGFLRGVPGRAGARLLGQRAARWLGSSAATGSRAAQGGVDGYDGLSQGWLDAARAYAAQNDASITVLGHGHWLGWWDGLVCLGDWLRWSSYGRLDPSGLSLWQYKAGGDELLLDAPSGALDYEAVTARGLAL